MKNENGITLVALIITIIILIILAVVSIMGIFNNDMINVASNSIVNYAGEQIREEKELSILHNYLEITIKKLQSKNSEEENTNQNNNKYLYNNGNEYGNISGGFEEYFTEENWNGQLTGKSNFKKLNSFMILYSSGSGNGNRTNIYMKNKQLSNKEDYNYLVLDIKVTNKANYTLNYMNLISKDDAILYSANLEPNGRLDRQYLYIPLQDINEEFYCDFRTSALYEEYSQISIFNIFLSKDSENGKPKETELPQGQEKVYILQPNKEFEEYTGGYIEKMYRYYNHQYTGISSMEVNEECINLSVNSNGIGYMIMHEYFSDNYINRGEYTKLCVELEAVSHDNYDRSLIILDDINGNHLKEYAIKANSSKERSVVEVDLNEINTSFRVRFLASAVSGGNQTVKIYNAYLSK